MIVMIVLVLNMYFEQYCNNMETSVTHALRDLEMINLNIQLAYTLIFSSRLIPTKSIQFICTHVDQLPQLPGI